MKDLTSGNIYKNFILFAIPMVLAGMLSQAYSTIDTIIAGKYIGDTALGAIGATSPLLSFLSAMFWGFCSGFSVYLARLFGAGEYAKIKNVLFTGLTLVSIIVSALSLLSIIYRHSILSLFKIDVLIYDDAVIYFVTYMIGLLMILGNTYGVLIMNAFGIGGFPLTMSILSAILNISGNLIAVKVFKLGVFGLALATVVSATIVTICYIFKLKRCFVEMGTSKQKPSVDRQGLFASASYALPNMLQQLTMYSSGMLISPMINGLGKTASAAYTVAQKAYEVNASIYQNSTKTVANYTSQACGGEKLYLIKKGVLVGAVQSIIFALPFTLACLFFPEAISGLFFDDNAEPQAIEYAVIFLSRFLPFVLINVIANLMHAFFRGLGEKAPLIFSTLAGSVARVAVSFMLIPKFNMIGMYIGWVASWIADALIGIIYYLIYITKNKDSLNK